MKKKKLFIIIVAAMLTVSVGSFAGIAFTTSCGVEGMTVGPDFFDNDAIEFFNYLQDLNVAYCGEEGPVHYVSDGPIELIP